MAGLSAHQASRLDEAEQLYAQALAVQPDHADALNLAGALAFARGDLESAVRLIGRSIRAFPSHLDAYLNLAEALEKAGRGAEAIDTCRKALEIAPDFVDGHARLARLNADVGDSELALKYGRVALALAPDSLEALCAQGAAFRRLNRTSEAEAAYRRALEIAPDDLRALTGLAALLTELGSTQEAAGLFRRALELQPDRPEFLASLAAALEAGGDIAAALALYDRALSANASADLHYRRANCLRDSGQFDEAEAGYRNALRLEPNFAPALLALTRLKRLDAGSDQQKTLARLAADTRLPVRHRVQAGFALGELLDRADDPGAAFRRFAEANGLYRKFRISRGEVFDRRELRTQVSLIADRLAREYIDDTAGWSNPTEQPVFVVGLPRSGTTLVEQICASHSQVFGAGELRGIQHAARAMAAHNPGRDRIAEWDAPFAKAQADAHAAELARLGGGALRVVDKTPLNLMRLGLIGAMFPNARIIRCRRDPRDVAVSNHLMYFAQGNLWSTDQSDCAYAVRQIERLGDCWVRETPLPVLEVVYEDLVADFQTQVPRIISFLGLDWEPQCMAFHDTDRQVNTPSSWQVRQPVYSSSVGRWRRYERHLGPMLKTLADAEAG